MSDPMALSLYAYRCEEDATEAWKSGDYEYAGYLRSEASNARARMAEIETQTRRAQEAVKGRSAGERQG